MSMPPGEDVAGSGGVVWYSTSHQFHMFQPQFRQPPLPRSSKAVMIVLVVKRARRGVANRGLHNAYVNQMMTK